MRWTAALAVGVFAGVALTTPATGGIEKLAMRLAAAARTLPGGTPAAPPGIAHGRLFNGTPAVGALFTRSGGRLGRHFCTASVVASPARDLVITAAHCVSSHGGVRQSMVFVPDYHRGREPYGEWPVRKVLVGPAWKASANPDADVAFLVVSRPGPGRRIQELTGGERLATRWGPTQFATVIGYPDATDRPVRCAARTRRFSAGQMEFDCGGYPDGTSGGPFLAHVSRSTGLGTVMGVIGGYQQGGDTPSVSYSARFGAAVRHLYEKAVASG